MEAQATKLERDAMSILDFGINAGYFLSAVALLMRNMLALRVLATGSGSIILFCSLEEPEKHHRASLVWSLLFLAINFCQMTLLLWERRRIVLTAEAHNLHVVIFPTLTRHEFFKLNRLAQWRDGATGTLLAGQSNPVEEIVVLYDAEAVVERDGQAIKRLADGAIIGELGALAGRPFSATIRLTRFSRYVVWEKGALYRLFKRSPSIASGFERAFILNLEASPTFRTQRMAQKTGDE